MTKWFIVAVAASIGLWGYSSSVVLADEPIMGVASVIDGDTIEIHSKRIRLFGIDAAENAQLCTRNGKAYRCGKEAAFALADKIGRRIVRCFPRDTDRYGRTVAVCRVGGVDINGWMVRKGFAVAYRKYSAAYVADEEEARSKQIGLWAGEFEKPWNYRRHKRRKKKATSPTPRMIHRSTPKVWSQKSVPNASDEQIVQILLARSQASYGGSCPCPENHNRAGRRCGKRSAYSRPGGVSPLCYSRDVTPAMIAEYRNTADH
jgi:endonuclease YncB( thermonuclease family)